MFVWCLCKIGRLFVCAGKCSYLHLPNERQKQRKMRKRGELTCWSVVARLSVSLYLILFSRLDCLVYCDLANNMAHSSCQQWQTWWKQPLCPCWTPPQISGMQGTFGKHWPLVEKPSKDKCVTNHQQRTEFAQPFIFTPLSCGQIYKQINI